jgi:hypothetical protein
MSWAGEAFDGSARTRINGRVKYENLREGDDGGMVADVTLVSGRKLKEVPFTPTNSFLKSGYGELNFSNGDKNKPFISNNEGVRKDQFIPELEGGYLSNPKNKEQSIQLNEKGVQFETDKKPIKLSDDFIFDPVTGEIKGNGVTINLKDKKIKGDWSFEGNLTLDGTLTASGNITAPNIP